MRLLNLTHTEIEKLVDNMSNQIKQLKFNSLKLTWYMRGGVGYNDIMNMGQMEVDAINQVVKENLEITKESRLPFF
jgi:hypothetical protein